LGETTMSTNSSSQFIVLAVNLLVVCLVWSYYHRRSFPHAERYSTFGPRFWTGAVDSLVLCPITLIPEALLLRNIPKGLGASLMLVQSLAWLVYTVVMHARYGQTVGKMVTKVRVVDFQTEGGISWRQAWLREGIPMILSLGCLGYEVFSLLTGRATPGAIASGELVTTKPYQLMSVLPGLWFLAEVVTMLTNEKRRALHDFIAGTVVIRTNTDDKIAQPSAPPNGGPATPLGDPSVTEGPPSVS
jgi:uncharacterized RDD family membrane protein YckC